MSLEAYAQRMGRGSTTPEPTPQPAPAFKYRQLWADAYKLHAKHAAPLNADDADRWAAVWADIEALRGKYGNCILVEWLTLGIFEQMEVDTGTDTQRPSPWADRTE